MWHAVVEGEASEANDERSEEGCDTCLASRGLGASCSRFEFLESKLLFRCRGCVRREASNGDGVS